MHFEEEKIAVANLGGLNAVFLFYPTNLGETIDVSV